MRRTGVLAMLAGAFVIVFLTAKDASAGADRIATQLSATTVNTTVSGSPADIHVRLTDAGGRPVDGAVIRLETTTTFLGSTKTEVLDEATTDPAGKAVVTFSPVATGSAKTTVLYEGDPMYAEARTTLTFDVRVPVATYDPSHVGIQAPWAHAYLILLPFFGIWITYGVVLLKMRAVRRAALRPSTT